MHEGKILKEYVEANNVNVTHFANELGVTRGNIYQLYGRDKFDKDLKKKIESVYTDIDFSQNNKITLTAGVPIFDIEFKAGKGFSILEARENCYPIGYLNIPEVKGCDLVARARGDSMPGVIEDGDWMGLKMLNDWKEWFPKNYPYAIVTTEQLIVKYAKRLKQSDFITVISTNKHYEDDEVPIKLILEMWQVKTVFPFSKIKSFI